MILNITIDNFKGIKNPVSLSCIASNKIKRSSNVYTVLDKKNKALKNIAIVGANGAGKTSILDAVETVQDFLLFPYRKTFKKDESYKEYINSLSTEELKNFLLSFDTIELGKQHNTRSNKFTNITIDVFIPKRKKCISGFYTYQLIYDQYYKKYGVKKEVLMYRKTFDSKRIKLLLDENDIIESEAAVSVIYKNNSSFVKNENIEYIESFVNEILYHTNFSRRLNEITLIETAEKNLEIFTSLCNVADAKIKKVTIDYSADENEKILKFWNSENTYLLLEELSNGTRKTLAIGCDIINSLNDNDTLLLDEMDNGMHFALSRFLIELNNTYENNYSQIIFTTHSPLLAFYLDNDQVYYIETKNNKISLNNIAGAINSNVISKDQNLLKAFMDGLIISNPSNDKLFDFFNLLKK